MLHKTLDQTSRVSSTSFSSLPPLLPLFFCSLFFSLESRERLPLGFTCFPLSSSSSSLRLTQRMREEIPTVQETQGKKVTQTKTSEQRDDDERRGRRTKNIFLLKKTHRWKATQEQDEEAMNVSSSPEAEEAAVAVKSDYYYLSLSLLLVSSQVRSG